LINLYPDFFSRIVGCRKEDSLLGILRVEFQQTAPQYSASAGGDDTVIRFGGAIREYFRRGK